jgi:cyclopropane-fatty-acyl-phospholipid synthase
MSQFIPKVNLPALYEPLLDNGVIPDVLIRQGVRHLLGRRLKQLDFGSVELNDVAKQTYIASLKTKPEIAIHTKEANEQHYELPTEFFQLCLGKNLKYSSCYFEKGDQSLDEAEEAMLNTYIERAGLKDGMKILDLGCGWGSLCLYLCKKFPNAKIFALSNSSTQREFILGKAAGYTNLKQVFTGDINDFEMPSDLCFDRILSIEMFEHLKNYQSLFEKVASWLMPETGRLFIHVFAHKTMPYDFKTEDDHSWMAKYFFTGGTMPSQDLFLWFQQNLEIVERWTVDGRNYGKSFKVYFLKTTIFHFNFVYRKNQ